MKRYGWWFLVLFGLCLSIPACPPAVVQGEKEDTAQEQVSTTESASRGVGQEHTPESDEELPQEMVSDQRDAGTVEAPVEEEQPEPVQETTPVSRLSDHSVNDAKTFVLNGEIHLVTNPKDNQPGSFNGAGVGNKAILGVSGFHKKPIGSLPAITLQSRRVKGTSILYFNVLVDLECNGGEPKILVVDKVPDGTASFDINKDEFKVVQNLDGKNTPNWLENPIKLSALTSQFPNACLVDSVSKDNGMPKDVKLSAVLLIMGDSNNKLENEVHITGFTSGGVEVR